MKLLLISLTHTISPSDCLHLQLYRDSKDRCKNGPTKASLSLEGFLGMETGFTLDKESNTMALICTEVVVVLAFDSRELLIQWQVKVRANLVEGMWEPCTAVPRKNTITPFFLILENNEFQGMTFLHILQYQLDKLLGSTKLTVMF